MRKYQRWMRHPRTTAEKRANQEGWERPRRRPHLLPDTYDDLWVRGNKSWKEHRKTQYHPGGRGKHNSARIEYEGINWMWSGSRDDYYILTNYLWDHEIPYYAEPIRRFRWTERFYWKRTGWEDYTIGDFTYQRPVHKKIPTGEFYRDWYIDHYIVHWWYNKDIGVDYILK